MIDAEELIKQIKEDIRNSNPGWNDFYSKQIREGKLVHLEDISEHIKNVFNKVMK